MKTKRILSILLVMVMCFTVFAGCKKNPTDDTSSLTSTDEFFDFNSSEETSSDAQTDSNPSSTDKETTKTPSTNSQTTSKQEGSITQTTTDNFVWPKLTFKTKEVTLLSPYDPGDSFKEKLKKQYGLTVKRIDVTWHEMNTRLAALTMAGQSPDLIYYRQDNADFPSYIYKGFVQPIDDLVDWNNNMYKDLLWHYGKTKIGGKNYLLIQSFTGGPLTLYNKRAFKDAGVTDPWTLYKQGKWDWNTLADISDDLCADTNGDGSIDQKALAVSEPYSLMYTTGQTYGAIDDANKTCKSNIKNRNIARAMNFMYDLIYTKGVAMRGIMDGDQQFADEFVAMNFVPCNSDALDVRYEKMRKRGDMGIAPMPKDPNASKLYYYTRMSAMFVGKNAKNPQGAIAYNAVSRFYELDKTEVAKSRQSLKDDYKFTNDMIEAYYESIKSGTPVIELTPFIGYNSTWTSIQEGMPWASQLAKDEQTIQNEIDSVFAAN